MGRARTRTDRQTGRSHRAALRPRLEGLESRQLLANFLVTTTSDTPIAPTPEVPAPLTLRQAITLANANPGPDTISFGLIDQVLPGVVDFDKRFQAWRIRVNSPLPAITDLVSIDGYSQRVITGSAGFNKFQSFSLSGLPTDGTFTLSFEGQTTAPIDFNATAKQVQAALEALPNIGAGNINATGGPVDTALVSIEFWNALQKTDVGLITGDGTGLIGTNPSVFIGLPSNGIPGNITSDPNLLTTGFNAAVRVILDGSQLDPLTGNITQSGFAGLTLRSDHNRIRGLSIDGFETGIAIEGPSAIGNLIQGNYVGKYLVYLGANATGANTSFEGIGNGVGVLIASPTNNSVGGVSPETHNAISGNVRQGVRIAPGAIGNQVVGNLIGVLEESSARYYQVGNGQEGILVESSSNAIGGAVEGSTNVISANGTYGIHVVGPDATRNRIQANYVGTDVTGTFIFGQGNPGNGSDDGFTGNLRDGVYLDNAPNNMVGITGASVGPNESESPTNVISGNFGAGVRIAGASATGNVVLGNHLGTNLGGTSALPNFQEGVAIFSAGNRVGGLNPGDHNIISGNRRGVLISGVAATGNVVVGNFIGTDGATPATGTYDLGNAQEGVRIEDATGNTIGGLVAAARNIISGNNVGVAIVGGSATGNRIVGNYIGTDATGLLDLANSLEGVKVESASGNTIGGASDVAGNVISANHWGVRLSGPSAIDNFVQGNFIGTGPDGLTNVGNELDGVLITDGSARNRIGGGEATDLLGNIIAFNIRDGVRVESDGSVGNGILSNSLFLNGGLGINLVAPNDPSDGVTPNDPGDLDSGPNTLINAPTLTRVASTANGVLVSGTYSGAPNLVLRIQVFVSAGVGPTGLPQAGRFGGTTTLITDSTGSGTFTATFPVVVGAGQRVTATATDPANNTSELSPGLAELIGTIQFAMSNFTASEGDGQAIITVTRVGGSGGFATVGYRVANGTARLEDLPAPESDYNVAPGGQRAQNAPFFTGTIVFGVGENEKTIIIPLINDDFPEPVETINLSLSMPTGAVTLGTPSSAILEIVDDDLPGAFRFSMAEFVVPEGDGTVTITVVRDFPGIPVTVQYATAGGTATPGVDYSPVAGTLSFGRGETVKSFTIQIFGDAAIEGNETVGLILSNPTGGATLADPRFATLTIVDDLRDRTGPTVQSVRFVKDSGGGIVSLVITYNEALNPSTAALPVNYGYSVRTAGRARRFKVKNGLLIPFRSTSYNPSTLSVTLNLGRGIHPPTLFLLAINGSTDVPGAGLGVSDLDGNLLDGNRDGVAGGPFAVVLSGRTGPFIASPIPARATGRLPRGPRVHDRRRA